MEAIDLLGILKGLGMLIWLPTHHYVEGSNMLYAGQLCIHQQLPKLPHSLLALLFVCP
jgi:hypothetical protein